MMLKFVSILLSVILGQCLAEEACSNPLGMEDGKINNSQITTSSNFRPSCVGWLGRLRNNISPWGAWCPNQTDAEGSIMVYKHFIQIDLLTAQTVTKIETQGREYKKGVEYTSKYQISYCFDDNNWKYLRENGTSKIFQGNEDASTVVTTELITPIIARYVRIYPGYYLHNQACLRLELYGCPWKEYGQVRSYFMPVGQSIPNGKIKYMDTIYTGIKRDNFYIDGVGLLTDGQAGPVDSKELKGGGWVGWLDTLTKPYGVNITFEFYKIRKFNKVIITTNINPSRAPTIFNSSRIFFANAKDTFVGDSFLEYCPIQQEKTMQNLDVTFSLCGNIGKFVKLQLFPRGKLILISEIKFETDPVQETTSNVELKKCSGGFPITTVSTEPRCQGNDCVSTGTVSDSSNNTRTTILIICVVLLAVIILLVLLFILYRRRLLCFGMFRQQHNKDSVAAVHVELQERDSVVELAYDKLNDDIGNPLYASVDKDDEKQPMVSPAVMKKDGTQFEIPDEASDVYSEPTTVEKTPIVHDEYADPVDCVKKPQEVLGNPIYEGVYSEPLYGTTGGTILVGPQDETLKRGSTMERFPSDHLVFKEKIGDGQFGEVHIAEANIGDLNVTLGDEYKGKKKITVAVKTLKNNVSKDIRTDFFKEVRVMSRLQHDNVVRLLGVCREEPVCMIVEYMENGDLNQYLRGHVIEGAEDEMIYANTKQPIRYEELVYIAFQIASGMKYFASMNFVHRDLAARNCLVGEGLIVKLADFGMSRLLYSKHYYRVQGKVMLPIRWMAPESIFQGRFTTQTDVWSFGITLWEVFTLACEFPYPDLSDEEVIGNAKIAFSKQPTSKVTYNKKPDICPQDIYAMIRRCWASNPAKRPEFQSMYDLLKSKVGTIGSLDV